MQGFMVLSMVVVGCVAQSPFYGRRPIGYPAIEQPSTEGNALGDRFGNGETTTTQRLPIEALGDRALVNRLSKLPVDQQPFWLLNWRALEQHRLQHPTFQQSPSSFIAGSAAFNGPLQRRPTNGLHTSILKEGTLSALVDHLRKLPVDQQPFWFLNWRALEQHRQQHPTFQQSPSSFIAGSAAFNGPLQRCPTNGLHTSILKEGTLSALVGRLRKLPVDQQPFWLLNWRALEQHRQQHPTFQQSPSSFIAGSAAFNGPLQRF